MMGPRWTSLGSKLMETWLLASSLRVRASPRSTRMNSSNSSPMRPTTSRTGSAASGQTCATMRSTSRTTSCDADSPSCLRRMVTHPGGLTGPRQRRDPSRHPLPLGLPCPHCPHRDGQTCRGRPRLRSQQRGCLAQSGALILFIHCPSAAAAVPGALALLPSGASTGAGAASLLLPGCFSGQAAGQGPSSTAAGGTLGLSCPYWGEAFRHQGTVLEPSLPAAGNKGVSRQPCCGPTRGQVSLLWAWGGGTGTPGGRRHWWHCGVSPCVPAMPPLCLATARHSSALRRGRTPAATDQPLAPCHTVGTLWGSRPLEPQGHRPSLPPGPVGAMAWGQRGRSPTAVPRPLSRAPDVTAEPGQCHRATSSPCG